MSQFTWNKGEIIWAKAAIFINRKQHFPNQLCLGQIDWEPEPSSTTRSPSKNSSPILLMLTRFDHFLFGYFLGRWGISISRNKPLDPRFLATGVGILFWGQSKLISKFQTFCHWGLPAPFVAGCQCQVSCLCHRQHMPHYLQLINDSHQTTT